MPQKDIYIIQTLIKLNVVFYDDQAPRLCPPDHRSYRYITGEGVCPKDPQRLRCAYDSTYRRSVVSVFTALYSFGCVESERLDPSGQGFVFGADDRGFESRCSLYLQHMGEVTNGFFFLFFAFFLSFFYGGAQLPTGILQERVSVRKTRKG